MSLGQVDTWAIAQDGVHRVRACAQLQGGLPMTRLLKSSPLANGLKDRVRAAIKAAGFRYPPSRVTLDLELPPGCPVLEQHGAALAIAILIASDQVPASVWDQRVAFGALDIGGGIQAIPEDWGDTWHPSVIGAMPHHLAQCGVLPAKPTPLNPRKTALNIVPAGQLTSPPCVLQAPIPFCCMGNRA